jgi:hypothetical protein
MNRPKLLFSSTLSIRSVFVLLVLSGAVSFVADVKAADPPSPLWVRQFGGDGIDIARGITADILGNVYVSGYVEGAPLVTSLGGRDAFLQKFDSAGTPIWTRQFGTSNHDASWGLDADQLGNVYVAGDTMGTLGAANFGGQDAYLRKYDSSGNVVWTGQFGTSSSDEALKASYDGFGHVYVSGHTRGSLDGTFMGGDSDAFVAKYDDTGNLLWTRQLGSSGTEVAEGVAADSFGNVFIGGRTNGNLVGSNAGSWDGFISKYDASGNLSWTRQFGTAFDDRGLCVAADNFGNAYISGFTSGVLQSGIPSTGSNDVFISKYDSAGTLLWRKQAGTGHDDIANEIASDSLGNVFITGETSGPLGGPSAGDRDTFLLEYNPSGSLIWSRQIGTSAIDDGYGISSDGLGNIYATGRTAGNLGGPIQGEIDAFVVKFAAVPEPTSLGLALIVILGATVSRRKRLPTAIIECQRRKTHPGRVA